MMTNNITRMLFKKAYLRSNSSEVTNSGDGKEFQNLVRECFQLAGAVVIGDFIPVLQKLDLGGTRAKMWKLRHQFDTFFMAIIHEHHQKMKASPDAEAEDLVDVLLSLQEDKEGHKVTDDVITTVLGDMLLAGTDTSSDQIVWTLTEIMHHPDIREKVQSELDAVVGTERLVDESDIPQLKYLELVVKESMRLHPVAPLLVPHESIAATKIAGYDIPAETRVYVNTYAIQRDPQVWEDPLTFHPERFVKSHVDYRGHDFELLPFGSGRRMCPGMNLALSLVHLTLARLLQTCAFSLPAGTNPEDVDQA